MEEAKAVLCRPLQDLARLAFSDHEIYPTFYKRTEAGLHIPGGSEWDNLRSAADTILFGDTNKKHVRFAALSVDGLGVERYGECSITLKTDFIAHRTSLLEENSVGFMKNHSVGAANDYRIPPGYRAPWQMRARLAVAKLADSISKKTRPADFPTLVLSEGSDGWTDKFIELQIWGSFTIRTVAGV